jgi:hypothetical protein
MSAHRNLQPGKSRSDQKPPRSVPVACANKAFASFDFYFIVLLHNTDLTPTFYPLPPISTHICLERLQKYRKDGRR